MDIPLLDNRDVEERELADLTAPPLIDEGIRKLSLVSDLDRFFSNLYEYYREGGLWVIATARACNLMALGFTVLFSGLLLLGVNWGNLRAPCIRDRTCDMAKVLFNPHPLAYGSSTWRLVSLTYLCLIASYWAWSLFWAVYELWDMYDMRVFLTRAGLSDNDVQNMTWPEVLDRVLKVQSSTRLALGSDLTELHAIAAIMRRDNYIIAMVNMGVLDLTPSWARRRGTGGGGGGAGGPGRKAKSAASAAVWGQPAPPSRLSGLGVGMGTVDEGQPSGSGELEAGQGGPEGPVSLWPHFFFTQTLEWNVRWVILGWAFDERRRLRRDRLGPGEGVSLASAAAAAAADGGSSGSVGVEGADALARRLRAAALINLAISPFLALFLVIYYFLRNAEHLYHHPSSAATRRWAPLATWAIREINELPHQVENRLTSAQGAADRYVSMFRSRALSYVARLIAYVAGSFAALVLGLALIDDDLLERPLLGRNLVWWGAGFGVVLAVARGLADEEERVFDPEGALRSVAQSTRHWPRRWRGRAHTAEVRDEFLALFPLRPLLFLAELASVVLNPLILGLVLPRSAPGICAFLLTHTRRVEGVGDVCSLSVFDFVAHGDESYGSPPPPRLPSAHGKLEKSFVSFASTYPAWEPPMEGKQLLKNIGAEWVPGAGVVPREAAAAAAAAAAANAATPSTDPSGGPSSSRNGFVGWEASSGGNGVGLSIDGVAGGRWKGDGSGSNETGGGSGMIAPSPYGPYGSTAAYGVGPGYSLAGPGYGGGAWSHDPLPSLHVAPPGGPLAFAVRQSALTRSLHVALEDLHWGGHWGHGGPGGGAPLSMAMIGSGMGQGPGVGNYGNGHGGAMHGHGVVEPPLGSMVRHRAGGGGGAGYGGWNGDRAQHGSAVSPATTPRGGGYTQRAPGQAYAAVGGGSYPSGGLTPPSAGSVYRQMQGAGAGAEGAGGAAGSQQPLWSYAPITRSWSASAGGQPPGQGQGQGQPGQGGG